MEKKQKLTLAVIIALVVLLFVILAVLGNLPQEETITPEMELEIISEKLENKTINKLADMNEEERMRFYLAEFMRYLENAEYEEAYNVLNSDFKDNYFKTYEEFETYAKNKFPKEISIQYDNFERNGEIYIFWITINNPLTSTKDAGIEMNVVMKEHNFNDFEMSFSVI